ncbi:MAG: aromatic ring-hydroxylating dioxygenase subunit alpha [Candidatus Heimdallarchaeota archaeon]|nr:aromatic ring-hydroxylating dioxygenase subunit alpha [Candidatus Heimdallarchaeota archaeon]
MIPNQWYAVLESKQVKKGQLIGVVRLGEKLVFWRIQNGDVHCTLDKCIHRGAQLSKGKVINHRLECPFHGFQYDKTGEVKVIPARGKNAIVEHYFKQRAYITREMGGLIFIYWGKWPEDEGKLPAVPMFEELLNKDFKYYTKIDHWNVHYSLVIENQLDVVHLPFVHSRTIGRGYRTLVHGPGIRECQGDDGLIEIQVQPFNVKDDGITIPLKYSEIPDNLKTYLYFRFPNIWMNRISNSTIIFIAFSPIDEENTLLYLRFYLKSSIPLLGAIIGRVGARGNLLIAGQDKRVVITQHPLKSVYKMQGQKLIQGDRPIVEYRRIRQKLIENYLEKRNEVK